jgi:PAS domain S-box-containing protein
MKMKEESFLTHEMSSVIIDSISDGVFTVDKDFIITSINRAAEKITGVPRLEAVGKPCHEVFRADICEGECAMKKTLGNGRPLLDRNVTIISAHGLRTPISVSTAPLRNKKGEIVGGVEIFHDLTVVEALRHEVDKKHTYADIISKNKRMKEIFALLPRAAESGSTVLIEGESGTGKELLAKAIHSLGPKREGPLVTVNCGALPDTLLESELFGYAAGAFTDARKDKPGKFVQAGGGTIFLDEIGDVSPALQARLLRVLQEKTVEPLGSNKTIKVDVHVITATNKDLKAEVDSGKFRQDLFYRVNVLKITLPPLRERKEDIPLLVNHFIEIHNNLRGKDITGLSQASTEVFMRYDWPGNIRELENAIEHAFILRQGGLLEPQHFPETLRDLDTFSGKAAAEKTLQEIEIQAICNALTRNNGKRSATARELGIDKTTLWRKMKKLNLSFPP